MALVYIFSFFTFHWLNVFYIWLVRSFNHHRSLVYFNCHLKSATVFFFFFLFWILIYGQYSASNWVVNLFCPFYLFIYLFYSKFVNWTKRIREIHKITLVEVITEDVLVKKAMENMILEMNTCGLSKHCLIFGSQHYLFGDPQMF